MRETSDLERIQRFMREFGAAAQDEGRVYFTGGVTAVLMGWRSMTVDADIKIVPEQDQLLKAIQRLKETLRINVELASPDQFIPPIPGWEERSVFIAKEGKISFYHYDPYSQALAKIERGHRQDLEDVHGMFRDKLIKSSRLLDYFKQIEPNLYRYPAIDITAFRRAVEDIARSAP